MALVEHEEEYEDETAEPFPCARLICYPDRLPGLLRPVPGKRLHYAIEGHPGREYVPYWEVDDEFFSVFPVFQPLAIIGKGRFTERASYRIVQADPADQIRIAFGGTDPHLWAPIYDEKNPPEMDFTSVLRVRAFRDGQPVTEAVEKFFRKVRSL